MKRLIATMLMLSGLGAVVFAETTTAPSGERQRENTRLVEPVRPFVQRVTESFDSLPTGRQQLLDQIAKHIVATSDRDGHVQLNFICTHNSRRSQFGQVWCQIAAHHYEVPGVNAFSGGTETTACNIRTVRALRRSGLSVVATGEKANPVYLVQYADSVAPLKCFSKLYEVAGNASTPFIAMMCCSDADRNCPVVSGSQGRFALHYEDPKVADRTPQENERYNERCFQIAQEMFYLMSQVAQMSR
ncbi:protein-tyrosine-phosphatase [Roseiconus lacunae]|uniref:protein-tyrosine-phosphatase n=1 Tax=Roseiconus lacunae TaxID=2605694 RepID=UPI001E3D949A|nr:protein-tyrosine-phosphatase [Roseiconus lacunae]MCD0461197.1 protein-tyrosine-phosphatase [Roseiconus lacunae]WRQ51645.1 protein-tyrosine-phosphatase [Stieleria sp. HD01]